MKCPLCGLIVNSLPSRPRDETGVSCRRCGDFYIDGMLTYNDHLPADEVSRAILSGFTKWAAILGKPPVEINANNIDKIIKDNQGFTQYDKVDLLLKFFSIKEPTPGHNINIDIKLDIPVIYSADENEFSYLIFDFAQHELGYLQYVARSTIKITPSGWSRINWLNRIHLADEKFNLINEKIDKDSNLEIANEKEKASISHTRHSSSLASQIEGIILDSVKSKLHKKLEIDREIIFSKAVISYPNNINFQFERITAFWEKERASVLRNLENNYKDCNMANRYDDAKGRVLEEVEKEIKLVKIGLKAGELNRKDKVAEEESVTKRKMTPDPKRVFVVYGRNEKARKALFELLGAVGLKPFEWSELVKETEKGAPYVGEILDVAFEKAQAVIVLFTGDDVAYLREEYIMPNDPDYEGRPSPQARANVIFEAGKAFGTHPTRTILVELDKERTRPFSDIGGRHFLRLYNSNEKRKELIERLKTARCDVCMDGEEWMNVGDFDGAVLGWPCRIPEKVDRVRGRRKAQKPEFDRELGTANVTGFSKNQIWEATLRVLKTEAIEVLKTSESWIFAQQTTGEKVEVDIGIVDHPERDELRPWAPAVSIGIDVPRIGELGDYPEWTTDQRRALGQNLYQKIIDVLYGG